MRSLLVIFKSIFTILSWIFKDIIRFCQIKIYLIFKGVIVSKFEIHSWKYCWCKAMKIKRENRVNVCCILFNQARYLYNLGFWSRRRFFSCKDKDRGRRSAPRWQFRVRISILWHVDSVTPILLFNLYIII